MEPIRQSAILHIQEETQVAVARRTAHDLGNRLGLDEETVGRAEIVAVELARNLLQHAGSGQIVVSSTPSAAALQILSLDLGPGIPSVARALEDGYTTANTPGLGLGAARRLAQEFEIFTQPGKGSVVCASVGPNPSATANSLGAANPRSALAADAGVLSTCLQSESVNGDSWAIRHFPRRTVYLVVDGLGHGLYASEAANLAVSLFNSALDHKPTLSLSNVLTRMHEPMRATRGAAIAIVEIDYARSIATCCGIGNISCVLALPDGTSRSMVSHNGTLGHQMRRIQEFEYPFVPGTLLIMHSDGIATHWKLASYPGLGQCLPATIAGVLYRDAVRGRDDASILVDRLMASPEIQEPAHV